MNCSHLFVKTHLRNRISTTKKCKTIKIKNKTTNKTQYSLKLTILFHHVQLLIFSLVTSRNVV